MKPFCPSHFFDLSSFHFASIFEECVHVWDVLPCIKEFLLTQKLNAKKGAISEQAHLINPETIYIGEGAVVEPGAYIKGPCYIGNDCIVRHGAYIRGNLITGERCVIGHATEVKNCLLLNDAKAAHFAYLGDSVLGNHVNLGAGTKCANLRLDHGEVMISFEGEKFATGRKKVGAIFGDHSETGCNAVTNPGTVFGKGARCFPALNVGGVIPAGSTVFLAAKPVIK